MCVWQEVVGRAACPGGPLRAAPPSGPAEVLLGLVWVLWGEVEEAPSLRACTFPGPSSPGPSPSPFLQVSA